MHMALPMGLDLKHPSHVEMKESEAGKRLRQLPFMLGISHEYAYLS